MELTGKHMFLIDLKFTSLASLLMETYQCGLGFFQNFGKNRNISTILHIW